MFNNHQKSAMAIGNQSQKKEIRKQKKEKPKAAPPNLPPGLLTGSPMKVMPFTRFVNGLKQRA